MKARRKFRSEDHGEEDDFIPSAPLPGQPPALAHHNHEVMQRITDTLATMVALLPSDFHAQRARLASVILDLDSLGYRPKVDLTPKNPNSADAGGEA